MREYHPQLVLDGLIFPEAPRWHKGELWFSDMWDFKVYRMGPGGEPEVVAQVPERPSGLAFLKDGTPIVVSMVDRKLCAITPSGLSPYADLSSLATGDANDLLLDAKGRAYVGNFGYDLFGGADFAPADMLIVDPDGAVRVAASDLTFPNGMVLLGDGKTLVVAETWANRLTAFECAPDGTLQHRREFASLGERTPDGLCIDRDGGIWVACFTTGEVIRVLDGGEVTDVVNFPGKRAVACALGGGDGKTLYCATYAGEVEDIHTRRRAGALESVRVEIPGQGFAV